MSIFGAGTSDFAPLSGLESEEYGEFTDLNVSRYLYLKDPTDSYEGFNAPLITTDKTNDDMYFNTTTLSSNFNFSVGTGQETKETVFSINPTNGLGFEANNNPVTLSWNELSYLNNARSNIQDQIDNLDPDLSSNQGYWGNFWNNNTVTNPTANAVNTVPFPSSDPDSYGISITSSNRVTVGHAGIYMFIATIQIAKNPSGNNSTRDVFFWIRKNGVDVPDTAFKESIAKLPVLLAANWQLKLQTNDYFQLMWSSPDTDMELLAFPASSTPTKPAVPSVILTVSQVSFLVDDGASLLPLTYDTATDNLLCDASLQVLGSLDVSGNSYQFFTKITPITVQNYLWTDGSGATPTPAARTTIMFDNVKNQTFAIQGWTFSGTAIASINGMGAEWNLAPNSGFNNYNFSPPPGAGNFWLNFNCRSPGTTQSNSTFYLEAPPTLQPGMYIVTWYSKFTAGGQFSTTSLNLSLGSGATLLSYNDSDTRSTNVFRFRSITIEVKTAARLRWTYRDTQATPNQYFSASICKLEITQYPAVKVFNATNNTYLGASLSQLNNVSMLGTNSITGALSMIGIPSFLSSKGSNNVCISTQFTQAALATQSSNNIVIGEMAFYAENFQKCVLIGQNGLSNNANQQKITTECIVVGGDTFGGCIRDIMIGVGNYKNYATTTEGGGDCVLMGSYIGNNATTFKNMSRSVCIGNYIWGGYPGTNFNGELLDNVAIGYATQQTTDSWFGSYSTAVGSQSMRYLRGNLELASYNTALGYRSGVDPRAPTIQAYQLGIYSYQTYVGAYARTNGDISGCQYGVALGYNAQTDASYCTVIGADASYNVQNTIRLGRPEDTTVASKLSVLGITSLTGNTSVGNLSVSGTLTGVSSFPSLSITNNLSVGGNHDISGNLGVLGTTTLTGNTSVGNLAISGTLTGISSFPSLSITNNFAVGGEADISGNLTLAASANIVSSTLDARFSGLSSTLSSSISAVNTKADNAQTRADDAYDLAAIAQGIASGAAGGVLINAGAITTLGGTVTLLSGTVGAQGTAITNLQTSMTTEQSKTQYMLPVSTLLSTSKFFNNISIYETSASVSYSIYLSPTTTSTFTEGVECKTISTLAGNVQNIRGSTVNIADASGAANIDCSNVSIGNVANSSIQIGQSTSTLNANMSTVNLGNTSASNVKIGASNSNITIGGLSSSIYINGVLYIPFNPASFVSALAQWT